MNVTAVFASPHRDGHTAALLRDFLHSLPQDAHVDMFDCYALAPKPCTDCGFCKTAGRCVSGELDALFQACERSDVLIVASPVYNYSVPAPLKAILDRAQPYYYKNFRGVDAPTDPRRKGYLLLTAGRSGKFAFEMIKKQIGIFFKVLGVTYTDEIFVPHTDETKETLT
ncbi:MAG: NAD(P)H-dependent oxidoreductase [Clostridia bacterium]|nr:NAD(P)H-dependent oxidoreductase [Clostridia bacterium]